MNNERIKKRLYAIHKKILKKYGQEQLDYYRSMTSNNRETYSMYAKRTINEYASPQEWFEKIRAPKNKLETYVLNKIGNKYMREYNNLEKNDKTSYYLYLLKREKYGLSSEHILTPNEWVKNKINKELNTDFRTIGETMNLSTEAVRQIYLQAIKKIKKIIRDNPKYRYLDEFL